MNKINGTTVCNILSILLILGFIINTVADYVRYSTTLNSAPFYIWIIANVIYFIVPAMIVFVVGIVLKNKTKNREISSDSAGSAHG